MYHMLFCLRCFHLQGFFLSHTDGDGPAVEIRESISFRYILCTNILVSKVTKPPWVYFIFYIKIDSRYSLTPWLHILFSFPFRAYSITRMSWQLLFFHIQKLSWLYLWESQPTDNQTNILLATSYFWVSIKYTSKIYIVFIMVLEIWKFT